MTFHRLLFVINAMPRKEHNMDVRETTELDEDERIITIADGSDTGIVNNQVPEADIIRYKDSTYEIVSKIAYLIGVPKRIFENEHEPPKTEVYERLEQDKAARIIRHLCIIRTAIERNFKHINEKMRFDYTSIYNLPEYIPPDSMTQLSADGVNFVRKSSKKLCHHVIEINKLIADRINNCKDDPAMRLTEAIVPVIIESEAVQDTFEWARFINENGIADEILNHPVVRLAEKLFNKHRLLDYHRILFDIPYREKLISE